MRNLDQSKEAATTAALALGAVDAWHLGDGTSQIVGVPGMAALSKTLAHGLDVTLNTRVQKVESCGGLCEIQTDAGKTAASHETASSRNSIEKWYINWGLDNPNSWKCKLHGNNAKNLGQIRPN